MDEFSKEELLKVGAKAFERVCDSDLRYKDVRRAFIGEISRTLVYRCFRNGPIEDLHGGRYVEFEPDISRISDEEMAVVMKAATTSLAKYLEILICDPEIVSELKSIPTLRPPNYWDDPDWEAIDKDYDLLRSEADIYP